RSLVPRATSVSLFDATGSMRWTSETTTGPDFYDLVENALKASGPSPQGPGLMRMLDGNLPVYLCWVRDDAEQLMGVVAVVCRQSHDPDSENRGFSFPLPRCGPCLKALPPALWPPVATDHLAPRSPLPTPTWSFCSPMVPGIG